MSTEHSDATQSPDDFDRQLRDLYASPPGTARFKEPSAAERARRAARRRRLRLNLRKAAAARKLRRPPSAGQDERHREGNRPRPRSWGDQAPGRGRSGQQHRPAPRDRRQRLISLAKGAAILVGFAALLLVLHLLGFGPQ